MPRQLASDQGARPAGATTGEPPLPTRRAGAERTRSAILATAGRLFAERGYQGTSIADIAEEAGLAPGTIYVHFKNKEDLLAEVIRSTEPNELALAVGLDASLRELFTEIGTITVRQTIDTASFLTSMAHEARKFPETQGDFYQSVLLRPMQAVRALLDALPECESVAPDDRRVLAHLILSAGIFTVIEQVTLGGETCDPIDLERVPALLGRLLEGGLAGFAEPDGVVGGKAERGGRSHATRK